MRDLQVIRGERAAARRAVAFVACCLAILFGCRFAPALAEPAKAEAPRAEKIPKVVEVHGDRRTDDYHWLREKVNPKVLEYLKQENAYAEAVMEPTLDLQGKLSH